MKVGEIAEQVIKTQVWVRPPRFKSLLLTLSLNFVCEFRIKKYLPYRYILRSK